jgi:hypothetical protein
MGKAPAFQFYVRDWLSDPQLRMASHVAKGIWIDLLCFMWEAPDRGKLTGEPSELARMVGASNGDFDIFLSEAKRLKFADVTFGNTNVTVQNRRMVREQKTRDATRLRVEKHRSNAPSNDGVTVPSSSSSSSSSSDGPKKDHLKEHIPPKGGDRVFDKDIQPLLDLYRTKVVSKGKPGKAKDKIRRLLKDGITYDDLERSIRQCAEYHQQANTEDRFRQGVEVFFNGGWQDLRWWPEVQTPKARAGPGRETAQETSDRHDREAREWLESRREKGDDGGRNPDTDPDHPDGVAPS